jgi:hypothetical protein
MASISSRTFFRFFFGFGMVTAMRASRGMAEIGTVVTNAARPAGASASTGTISVERGSCEGGDNGIVVSTSTEELAGESRAFICGGEGDGRWLGTSIARVGGSASEVPLAIVKPRSSSSSSIYRAAEVCGSDVFGSGKESWSFGSEDTDSNENFLSNLDNLRSSD